MAEDEPVKQAESGLNVLLKDLPLVAGVAIGLCVAFVIVVMIFVWGAFDDKEREWREREYQRQMEQLEQERLTEARGSGN